VRKIGVSVAGDEGDGEVGGEHHAVFEFRDGEGKDGRDENEIPGKRAGHAGDEDRESADAEAEGDYGEQVKQADEKITGVWREKPAGERERGEGEEDVEVFACGRVFGRQPFQVETGLLRGAFGRHNVEVDRAAAAEQAVDEAAAAQPVEQAGRAGFADDDLRGVVLEGDPDEGLGDIVVVCDDDLGPELAGEGEILFEAAAGLGREGAGGFDADGDPGGALRGGHGAGPAYEFARGRGPTATSRRSPERQTVWGRLGARSSRKLRSKRSATKRRASSQRAVRWVFLKKFSEAMAARSAR